MASNTVQRALLAGTLAAAAVVSLAGCDGSTAPGELGVNQQILASCPDGVRLNTVVHEDASGSGSSEEITAQRLSIIETLARRTAVCGGTFTVSAYSAGSAATAPIYSGELTMPGATDDARLRRVPDAVDQVMREITRNWNDALASVPGGGTDVAGMWRLAAEQQAQAGDGYQLVYVNLTDGLDNLSGQNIAALSPADAAAAAADMALPELPGAEVTIAGLGRVNGDPLSSSSVDALVAFYEAACERTGAESCLAVTDWRGSR
mgnify:CR=1 FL=1